MIDLVRWRGLYFLVSAVLVLPGVISLLLPGGLRPGIDFTSGTIMTVRFSKPIDEGALRAAISELGHPEAVIQGAGDNTYLIRSRPLEQVQAGAPETQQSERERIIQGLEDRFCTPQEKASPACSPSANNQTASAQGTTATPRVVDVLSLDQVSPLIATEIVWKSVLAVAAAGVAILLYLWWAFRRVPQPWRYGAAAVLALVHDALFVIGAFSILGRLFGIEIDSLFIVAVLTVIGFSVHDTIVVFDRIRENFVRHPGETFEDVVNHSLTQTLARSLNTSLTVLLTLIALLLFGGVTIRNFVLAMLLGITTGTYSSIFFASMLLVVWERGEMRGWWTRRRRPLPQQAGA